VSEEGYIASPSLSANRVQTLANRFLSPTLQKSALAIGGQGMVSCANFLTNIIIGRLCGQEELGLYSLGFTLVAFVSELQMSLISTPYMVFSPRLKGEAHARYTGSSLAHQLAFTAIAVLGLAVASVCIAVRAKSPGLAPVIGVVAAMIGFIVLREFVRRVCFAGLKMVTAFFFDAVVSVFQVGSLIALYSIGHLSAMNAYLTLGAVCGLLALSWIARNRRMFVVRMVDVVGDLKRNWALSKWVVASGILWSVSMNLYPWLISYFRGAAETGVFAACLAVANFGTMILIGAQNFLGPKIAIVYAESGLSRMRGFVIKVSAAFLVPMLPFCLLLWLLGDPIITLVFGPRYAGNGAIISVLALNLLALALAFSFSRALFALERADVDFGVNFAALFVLLTVGVWLVRAYGPLGAAVGLLIANVVASTVRGIVFFSLAGSDNRRNAP